MFTPRATLFHYYYLLILPLITQHVMHTCTFDLLLNQEIDLFYLISYQFQLIFFGGIVGGHQSIKIFKYIILIILFMMARLLPPLSLKIKKSLSS